MPGTGIYLIFDVAISKIVAMTKLCRLHGVYRVLMWLSAVGLVLSLTGCSNARENWLWIFNPNGPIASWSVYYLIVDVVLLLIIIVPATAITLFALYRYRARGRGTYDPSFNHSVLIEIFAWGVPIALVGVLSYFSYQGAYAVAPYDPQVLEDYPTAQDEKPLQINVIATNWQWLFIYPEQNVAIANKLILPVDRQINMRLTSAGATNDFFILKLVGQIYVMPGMRTKRKFILDRTGEYWGYSTEFSGPGFSWMDYTAKVVKRDKFHHWVDRLQVHGDTLSYERFVRFAQPTINTGNKIFRFTNVDSNLFRQVIRAINTGELKIKRPMLLTESMYSELFRTHATGGIPPQ